MVIPEEKTCVHYENKAVPHHRLLLCSETTSVSVIFGGFMLVHGPVCYFMMAYYYWISHIPGKRQSFLEQIVSSQGQENFKAGEVETGM